MSDVRCVSGVELLADYLEGLLPPDVRASLEEHVLGCERCQAFVASYQVTPAILRTATDVVLPEELRTRIAEWASAPEGPMSPGRRWPRARPS